MEKTTTINLRVNPEVKQKAENVLHQLGIPMAVAIDIYLRQISIVGGIPFPVVLPSAPDALNADKMSNEQLHAELLAGFDDLQDGRVHDAASVFEKFRNMHE